MADRDELAHDRSAVRGLGSRVDSAFRGAGCRARAAVKVSRPNQDAVERSGAAPVVRKDSVSLADAAALHRRLVRHQVTLPREFQELVQKAWPASAFEEAGFPVKAPVKASTGAAQLPAEKLVVGQQAVAETAG